MSIQINAAARDEIAEYLVSDRVTHRVLDRKFQALNVSEPTPVEPDAYKRSGLIAGVDCRIMTTKARQASESGPIEAPRVRRQRRTASHQNALPN